MTAFNKLPLLPTTEIPVLVWGKNSKGEAVFLGDWIYTKGGNIEFEDEDDSFEGCYDENAGCSFLPMGWYEMGPTPSYESYYLAQEEKRIYFWCALPTP